MTEENIKNFVVSFFKNMKCEMEDKGNLIIVKRVPQDFQAFSGIKEPYHLSFDPACQDENSHIMVKGSYLLKSMTSYLDNKAQTSLLKINFEFDLIDLIKKYFLLKNSVVSHITKKQKFEYFLRFTFTTLFQYLNEKEQLINHIFADNEKIINGDLSSYNVLDGKKEECSVKDVEKPYFLAKEKLKEIIHQRTVSISEELEKKLKKELARVKEHYGQELKEIEEGKEKAKLQIIELESQLEKADEKNAISAKINKLKETIKELSEPSRLEKIKKEESFFATDEIHKHTLSISNKLINSSIIYYPIFQYTLFLKNNDGGRLLDIEFNPLTEKFKPVMCDVCKKEINDIILCSGGHVSCNGCATRCEDCSKVYCRSCIDKKCGSCGKSLCKKCITRCSKCGKFQCKSHMKKNRVTGGEICISCMSPCSNCGQFTETVSRRSLSGKYLCALCASKEYASRAVSRSLKT